MAIPPSTVLEGSANPAGATERTNVPLEAEKPVRRVLVVEDDQVSRVLLRRILESVGDIEVDEAPDGARAWEILDSGEVYGLCFLDINMPRMSGIELLKLIRKDNRFHRMKVCYCSAVRDRELIKQAAAIGPDYYILKPYARATVLEQVRKWGESSGTNRSLESSEEVCRRLGIDADTYVDMINSFVAELRQLSTRLPFLIAQMDFAGAVHALDGPKIAAQTLGAHRISSLAEELTRRIKRGGFAGDREPNSRGNANNMAQWLGGYTDQLTGIVTDLQREFSGVERFAVQAVDSMQQARRLAADSTARQQAEISLMANSILSALSKGKTMAVGKSIRSRALTVPIQASLLGDQTERAVGGLVRKTSFSLNVLDETTARAVENCRGINDLVRLLTFELEGGIKWIPEAAIRLLEGEASVRNEQGVTILRHAIGDSFDEFLHQQEIVIRQNLKHFAQAAGQETEVPESQVQEIMSDVRERLQPALDGVLTTQPVFAKFDAGNLADTDDDARWAVPYSLLMESALLFRKAATQSSFDRAFKFNTFDKSSLLEAMNVLSDPMATSPEKERASKEKEQLEAIADSPDTYLEKCRQIWRLIRA